IYQNAEKQFGISDAIAEGIQAIYQKQGRHKQAIAIVKRLIAKQPDSLNGYLLLADVYLSLKKPKDALSTIRSIEGKFPNAVPIHLSKADAWQQLNKPEAAFDELAQ